MQQDNSPTSSTPTAFQQGGYSQGMGRRTSSDLGGAFYDCPPARHWTAQQPHGCAEMPRHVPGA